MPASNYGHSHGVNLVVSWARSTLSPMRVLSAAMACTVAVGIRCQPPRGCTARYRSAPFAAPRLPSASHCCVSQNLRGLGSPTSHLKNGYVPAYDWAQEVR